MRDELFKVTENVWALVLNLSVQRGEVSRAGALDLGFVSGCVELHGAWDGALVLTLSEPMARKAAATMLDRPLDDVDEQAYFDATGELANIIGGNIKALLPDDTALSPPQTGTDLGLYVHEGATELAKVELEAEGEPIEVILYRRLPLECAGA